MDTGPFRDARTEADQRLGNRYRALVLEPSPPAIGEPWFADDSVDAGPLALGSHRPVVSPAVLLGIGRYPPGARRAR